jgi:CheY-like chemotaxis protein/two-component sensor histidine kinase
VADDKAEMEHIRALIERQVRQLIRLIDDLLDLSRITRGKVSLQRQPTDLASVISATVETLQPAVREAEHELTVHLPDLPVIVDGDAARLRQVFGNILHNAVKYTVRHGLISVTLETKDGKAVVRVRDNGPGIPAAMLKDIFEAFHQVDATLGRSHGGLGIGLWLARQLVEQHGGSIEVASEGAGRGSEFAVTLPLISPPKEETPARQAPQQEPAEKVVRDVLVVDDMQESAETLTLVLRSLGHHVTALCDGSAVVDWMLAHRPEVVLLDIAMPGMDGYEVARRVRECPELNETVLVALTGHGQAEDRRRAFAAGFNSHLTKPTSVSMLRELLATLPRRRVLAETAGA